MENEGSDKRRQGLISSESSKRPKLSHATQTGSISVKRQKSCSKINHNK